MRAGMTHAKIADAATKLWLSGGADNFSIRAVAMALFVAAVENPNEINTPMVKSDRLLRANPVRTARRPRTPPPKKTAPKKPTTADPASWPRPFACAPRAPNSCRGGHASCAAAHRPTRVSRRPLALRLLPSGAAGSPLHSSDEPLARAAAQIPRRNDDLKQSKAII